MFRTPDLLKHYINFKSKVMKATFLLLYNFCAYICTYCRSSPHVRNNIGGSSGHSTVVVLLRHEDIAIIAPVGGPGVLNQPIFLKSTFILTRHFESKSRKSPPRWFPRNRPPAQHDPVRRCHCCTSPHSTHHWSRNWGFCETHQLQQRQAHGQRWRPM